MTQGAVSYLAYHAADASGSFPYLRYLLRQPDPHQTKGTLT